MDYCVLTMISESLARRFPKSSVLRFTKEQDLGIDQTSCELWIHKSLIDGQNQHELKGEILERLG